MALSLARDKLNYSPTQLDDLSDKLRFGDLTPILQIYEEDIKSPVRSAVSGTLLRSAFIQVQKGKVQPFARSCQFRLYCNIYPLRWTLIRLSPGLISFSGPKSSHSRLSVWRLHYHLCMLSVDTLAGFSPPAVATRVVGGGGARRHG
jgi:hypothetical protein